GGVGLWRDIILARYGPLSPSPHLGGRPQGLRMAFGWWRNVCLLGGPNPKAGTRVLSLADMGKVTQEPEARWQ
ncbi:hypothetical protein A2U01_0052503, partial [Trifolium medium]|nr:hypothetical protein [Trifolium medium]